MTIVVYPTPTQQPISGTVTVSNLPASPLLGESSDTPEAVYLVGNPSGDFAGVSPLEQALDAATGVTIQTTLQGVSLAAGALSVNVANPTPATVFPAVQTVSAVNTALPANASLENGGQLNTIQELLQQILIELRLATYQRDVAFALSDRDSTAFRNDASVVQ